MTDRELIIAEIIDKYGVQIQKKRKRSLLELDNSAFESYKAGLEIAHCCKTLDVVTAYEVFKKCERESISLTPSLFTNLLCLVAGLGDIGNGSNPERGDVPHDYAKAIEIFESMRLKDIKPSEAAYSAIIRCCCLNNQFTQAITLYEDMKSLNILPKLRCINSMIAACGKNGNTSTCFSLFQDINQRFHLIPTEKEYRNLLRACLNSNDVRFTQVLLEMMEELLTLSDHTTVHTIIAYFHTISRESLAYPYTITLSTINIHTGIIEASNQQLKSIDLDETTHAALLTQLESFAVNRDPNHRYKMNNKVKLTQMLEGREIKDVSSSTPATAADHSHKHANNIDKWNAFKHHLSKLQETPETSFNIIIDGANVGYYKQNFPNAPVHVDYHQIHALFTTLLAQGYQPLLILHSRHIADGIAPSNPDVQVIIQAWHASGRLYTTPKGFNDDWFWLYANINYHVPVVTNDEMRDHHFQLLSPRYFMRWRERHRVPFDLYFARDELNVYDDTLDDGVEDAAADTPAAQQSQAQTGSALKKNKIIFPPGVHRSIARFHFPLCFSYRMQYLHDGIVEGYYIPLPPVVSVSSSSVQDSLDSDGDLEEDVKLFIKGLYHHQVQGYEGTGAMQVVGESCNQEKQQQLWLAIYRLLMAAGESIYIVPSTLERDSAKHFLPKNLVLMASFAIEDADVEDKYTALSAWWERHCKSFSEWYLSLSTEQQKQLIMKAVPDMPEKSYHEKLSLGLPIVPTDIILPEFSLDGMLSFNGRLFCLFMTRRLASTDQCFQEDMKIIKDLYSRRELPSFSNQALESMDTPFIDPLDPDESIRSLGPTSGAETRGVINAHLESGRLVRAEVWMAVKIRRAAIVALMEEMSEEHYQAAVIKPSPTYKALLLGELQQQSAMVAMTEQQQQQSESTIITDNNSKSQAVGIETSSGEKTITVLEEVD